MAEPVVRIVWRDPHLLVLDKPPRLPTTAPDGGPCLVAIANRLDPDAPRMHPTSRLDAETSGVVVFARTQRATRALIDARRHGTYRRVYVALVAGRVEPAAGTWSWPIARDPSDPRKRTAADEGEGARAAGAQDAASEYVVAAATPTASVLHVRPRTGRTHQIRVHAARAGVSLLGDVHYGGPRRCVLADGSVVTARRVMLHCAAVAVPHPVSGDRMVFRSEAPADLSKVWTDLGGDPSALEADP